jgi:hypothetical protein
MTVAQVVVQEFDCSLFSVSSNAANIVFVDGKPLRIELMFRQIINIRASESKD